MAMIKTFGAADWGGIDVAPTAQVKIASGRLGGSDRGDFVKRAGEAAADRLGRLQLHPGEIPVHQIALGATEYHGSNRNGDGFKAAVCRAQHGTFVKFGKAFRDHINRPDSPHYGRIVDSWFNDDMGRLELIVGLYGTKEAAARFPGGRVADVELARLEKEGEYPTSMSTRVPYDECSSCQNRARTRAEYCNHRCKHGGLKANIGRVFSDGHVLHADNPINTWFDDSYISNRQADRVAYALGRLDGDAEKTAAAVDTIRPLLPLGYAAESWRLAGAFKAAAELSELEATDPPPAAAGLAFHPDVFRLTEEPPAGTKLAEAMAALAPHGGLLPIPVFLRLAGGPAAEKYAADLAAGLPGIFQRLAADPELDARLAGAAGALRTPVSDSLRKWAAQQVAGAGLAPAPAAARLKRAALRGLALPPATKVAAADGAAVETLAREYAAYQAALCGSTAGNREEPLLTLRTVLVHNSVSR